MTEKPAATVACTVLRDYWNANEARVRAGSVVHVSPDDAMDGIEKGTLARVKK